jgi:ATP-dependent RNA helicase DDX46/PRP5
VATSVCARGLDVKELELVVNYDCPNHYEDYVHRCGRTGRAGNKGAAHTLLLPDQGRYAGDLVKAFELSENLVIIIFAYLNVVFSNLGQGRIS